MRVAPRTIDMKADEFNDYLKEEGLSDAYAERLSLREGDRPARSAIRDTQARAAQRRRQRGTPDTAVGVKAELVPAADPTTLRSGEQFTLQLLVNGRPVPNAASTRGRGRRVPRQTDAPAA